MILYSFKHALQIFVKVKRFFYFVLLLHLLEIVEIFLVFACLILDGCGFPVRYRHRDQNQLILILFSIFPLLEKLLLRFLCV